MNWTHVKLIFQRELRDQLRDRRTLFTITVLPVLLYPLMGMLMLQVAQFSREKAVVINVIGPENLPSDPPLIAGTQLAERVGIESIRPLVEIRSEPIVDANLTLDQLREKAKLRLEKGEADLVVIALPSFPEYLNKLVRSYKSQNDDEYSPPPESSSSTGSDPKPSANKTSTEDAVDSSLESEEKGLTVVVSRGKDSSDIALRRWENSVEIWQQEWVAKQLRGAGVNPRMVESINSNPEDVAPESTRRAIVWSKILPFVMLIWALTGAFYPAVDLCAGEKERGTLETLLSSPARRREIVWGKLLTVMVFSCLTAMLNLGSMQFTASLLSQQLAASGAKGLAEALGTPPAHAIGWLLLTLIPMSAFFSALALAVAALARSTKEGQYYLMPLLLVTLPLVMLPIMPGTELNLGTSLVPVTGVVLLARALVEGHYGDALRHLPVVAAITITCCLMSIRWAVRQFESESVMFRENERYDIRMLLHYLWKGRGEVATVPEAILCGLIILVARFFAGVLSSPDMESWPGVVQSLFVSQVVLIATPCLLMAIILTRSLIRSLRLSPPKVGNLVICGVLAIALHPTYSWISSGIQQLYPLPSGTTEVLQRIDQTISAQPLWAVLLMMAVMPAICEEMAFRGFIFGGLLRQNGVLRAIILSAIFFGFSHGILQQQLGATLMGVVLGWIAWRTGGIGCTIVFHMIHNGITLTLSQMADQPAQWDALTSLVVFQDGGFAYTAMWTTVSGILTVVLAWWLYQRTTVAVESERYEPEGELSLV